jgi:hypothetical protein
MSTYITFQNKVDKSRELKRQIDLYNQRVVNAVATKRAVTARNMAIYNSWLLSQNSTIDNLKAQNLAKQVESSKKQLEILKSSTTVPKVPTSPIAPAPVVQEPLAIKKDPEPFTKGKSKMFLAMKQHKDQEAITHPPAEIKTVKKHGLFVALKKHEN